MRDILREFRQGTLFFIIRVGDIYGNIDARVKWDKCTRYGMVSVNLNKRVCAAYWESEGRR